MEGSKSVAFKIARKNVLLIFFLEIGFLFLLKAQISTELKNFVLKFNLMFS